MKQLGFNGVPNTPNLRTRSGVIGKVQRFIEANPWRTCGDIAKGVGEWSPRVSEALNKLKHEGNAQQRKGMGKSQRSLWAGTSEAGREGRERLLAELMPEHEEREQRVQIEKLATGLRKAGKELDMRHQYYGLSKAFDRNAVEA
jgi:predicted XRE-type DNA-binding protein